MVSKLIPQYEAQIIFLAFFIKIHEEVESELKKKQAAVEFSGTTDLWTSGSLHNQELLSWSF